MTWRAWALNAERSCQLANADARLRWVQCSSAARRKASLAAWAPAIRCQNMRQPEIRRRLKCLTASFELWRLQAL